MSRNKLMATESDDTTNVASRQSPRRRRPQRRTSSMYYGPISKALFPSSLTPKLVQQWFQSDGRSKFSSRHHSGYVWPVHDLLANEILLWLLPTHMLTHIIKLVVGLLVLLGCFLWCTLQQPQFYTTLWWVWAAVGLSIPAWIAWYYHTTLYAYGKPWMDPKLPAVNRMEMHVPLRLFQCPQKARRAACLPQLVARRCSTTDDDSDQESSSSYTPNVLLLDDMNWKFQLLPTVEDALMLVYQDNNLHDDEGAVPSEYDWKPIKIPGNWMLQGFNDIPIYTNQKYPFPCQPPVVPRQNPTGVYKLHVSIPEDWCSLEDEDQLSLMLHGIESAAFVFWNGDFLGFFKDSRLPSEFAIPSDFLVDETAVVHIVVVRWSDGSYVEDQDHWWMAGIHRSVELIRRRSGADILDYHVSSPASGNLCVSTHLRESSNNATKRKITARLYSDEQLTAEGDWKKKEEIWSTSKTIPKTATTLQLQGMIPNVQLWTAETPTLYTLVLELQQPSSPEGGDTITDTTTTTTTLQSESCRVGFRTIDVDSGILHVNGKRITICGINRHEHDPDHGKVVSLERMKQDITTLKKNNFNAIRTSHYPCHSSFYLLCDFYGMYVCDEANIETHGMKPMGRLAHDWGWENTFVSRVHRLVQRDWNHPCIILWSLGNEAGRGRNMLKARQSILDLDTSRPICYESGGSWAEGVGRTELTDIICPMYPDVERTVTLAQRKDEDRPIILCEYSHSMNNSNGNLHLYWEKFWKIPRLQGGFIWDMIDQGLRKKSSSGREYFAYGGDFGDKINDRQFCINGMFSPEREPHPAVAEIKYLQQPVDMFVSGSQHDCITVHVAKNRTRIVSLIEQDSSSPVSLQVRNRYVFRDLSHLSWAWKLVSDRSQEALLEGRAANENDISSIDLNPATRKVRELEELPRGASCNGYFLNIEGFLNAKQSWADAGHPIVAKQFSVQFIFEEDPPVPRNDALAKPELEPLKLQETLETIQISNGNSDPFVVFDKFTGGIKSIKWGDTDILCGDGLNPNFTRATTDNDRGGMELVLDFFLMPWAKPFFQLLDHSKFSYEMHWKNHGFSQDEPPKVMCNKILVLEEHAGKVKIEAAFVVQKDQSITKLEQMTNYEVFRDGRIRVSNRVRPMDSVRNIQTLPRIGLSFQLSPAFYKIQYFGRGPHENYPDRKSGSQLGLWKTTGAEMGFDYIVPSENGSRSDCRWASFDSGDGGIVVVADSGTNFCFSALLHSADELHQAFHTSDLDVRKNSIHPIYLNIDHKLLGVGGDVSWFPCVYPEYLVKAQDYDYSLWLIPLSNKEDPVVAARRSVQI